MLALGPVHDAPQIGPDAVGSALVEGVAGGAGLGQFLPLFDIGGGDEAEDRFRSLWRGGGGAGPALGGLDRKAGRVGGFGMDQCFGDEPAEHRHDTGDEKGGEDLVEFHSGHHGVRFRQKFVTGKTGCTRSLRRRINHPRALVDGGHICLYGLEFQG